MESKAETGLMRKTKKELVEIILRKDDIEIKLKQDVKSKTEEIESLNSRIVGYEADIAGLERMREENLSVIDTLKNSIARSKRNCHRWQIALGITVILAIAIIAIVA